MKSRLVIGLGLAFIALVALIPVPAAANQLFPAMAFSFSPYYYCGADWPPWDLSSEYYSAEWAPWDPWAMSGDYGWYRMYRLSLYQDTLWAQAWTDRHYPKSDWDPTRVKVVAAVAKPPITLAATRPMLEPKDRTEPGMRGSGHPDQPPGPRHGRKHDDRTEPASVGASRQNSQRPNDRGGHVRTWDEIIADHKARGRDWPPASMTNSDEGHTSTGSARSKGYYQAPTKPNTAAPSFSTGGGKQK